VILGILGSAAGGSILVYFYRQYSAFNSLIYVEPGAEVSKALSIVVPKSVDMKTSGAALAYLNSVINSEHVEGAKKPQVEAKPQGKVDVEAKPELPGVPDSPV